MSGLSAALVAKTIKTLPSRKTGRANYLIRNLLYKPILVPPASRCANLVCSLVPANSCFVLRTRSGPGEKTARSASQAGHGAAERCAKQEFTGDGSASTNKRANVGTFFVHKKPRSKDFGGTRDFSTTQFYSQTYRGGRTAHEVSSQQTVANSKATYANQTARGVRNAPQSGKKVASREYAGNRPFLDEGTRQKSLNRKNEPLTIEQVRELLNKNK